MKPHIVAPLILSLSLAPTAALAWDSMVVKAEGKMDFSAPETTPVCTPLIDRNPGNTTGAFRWSAEGLDAARSVFGGEHAFLTAGVFRHLGLSAYDETQEREIDVWAEARTIQESGRDFQSLTPVPWDLDPLRKLRTQRAYSVAGFAELPDFAHSLADWSAGNEHCVTQNVDRTTPEQNLACHRFTEVLGPVNSNHFLPQSRRVFEHYHRLAKSVLSECKRLQGLTDGWDGKAKSQNLIDQILSECETEGLILESIGLHFLQDSFSSGHMWERWANPEVTHGDLSSYFAVATLSGVIHGWRFLAETSLPGPLQYSSIIQDPLCAPWDETSSQYRIKGRRDNALHRGVGDEYLLPCLQYYPDKVLPALFLDHSAANVEVFGDTWLSMHQCMASAIADAYDAGPKTQGALVVPAYMAGIDAKIFEDDACWSRRATNLAMYKAMGLGAHVISPVDLAAVELVVRRVGGVVSDVILLIPQVREWRDTVVSLNAEFYINQKIDPIGIESAELQFGPAREIFGLARNGVYQAEAVPTHADNLMPIDWDATATGVSCASSADCGLGICNLSIQQCEPKEAATLRTFHRAHVDHWCSNTSREELDALRMACARDQSHCDLCVELARRHVRSSCDEPSWDAQDPALRVDGICHAERSQAFPSPKLYAGLLEDCDEFESADEAAERWCSTEDLSELTGPDPAGTLRAISAGGVEPAPVAAGAEVTLEVELGDLPTPANQTIRWLQVNANAVESGRCEGATLPPVTTRTNALGRTSLTVNTNGAVASEKIRVVACLSDPSAETPCNLCSPSTLTFTIRTGVGFILTKISGDNQVGEAGMKLPAPLVVQVVPAVPNGTELSFELLDGGLIPSVQGRLDGVSGQLMVTKTTMASRAQVTLTQHDAVSPSLVRVSGVDPALFPDPSETTVVFQAEVGRQPGDLSFQITHGSEIGPIDLTVTVDDGSILRTFPVHSPNNDAPLEILGFAPEGSTVDLTVSGTNQHGVVFTSRDAIHLASVQPTNALPAVAMLADRGHVLVNIAPGSAPTDRNLMVFDNHQMWPPVTLAGAPASVSVSTPGSFNVQFQDFFTNATTPVLKRRRHLYVVGYSPGNLGTPVTWPNAIMSEDAYLASLSSPVLTARANPGAPSESYAIFNVAVGTGVESTAIGYLPLKVFDPDETQIMAWDTDYTPPSLFSNTPPDTLVVDAPDDVAGYVQFAANGVDYPASPHGLLFFMIHPPIPGYVPGPQRSGCSNGHGMVQRVVSGTQCTTTSQCRITSDTALCGPSGTCEDFDFVSIFQQGLYCANTGAAARIDLCSAQPDFQCGPNLRCVNGLCAP